MNKNYLIHGMLMAVGMMTNQAYSMHKVIFYGSRMMGIGYLPLSLYVTHALPKPLGSKSVAIKPAPARIQRWGTDILNKLDVPSSADIVWVCGKGWEVQENKSQQKIIVPMLSPSFDGDRLDYALDQKRIQGLSLYEWAKENIVGQSDSFPLFSFTDQDNEKIIARNSIILKHEAGHIVNEDNKNCMKSNIGFLVIVQAAASTSTYCFNRLLNIKPPKTVLRALGRSVLAAGGIISKLYFIIQGRNMYARHREKRADEYACKNAETRLELTEFVDFFEEKHSQFVSYLPDSIKNDEREIRKKHRKYDPYHPYYFDRIALVEKYIQKWDKEHKNESNNE